jgi:hypothetical protein
MGMKSAAAARVADGDPSLGVVFSWSPQGIVSMGIAYWTPPTSRGELVFE